MPGVSYVPDNGRQTPLRGVIWVPSAVRVKSGFGRRNAVISCAFDSSIPISPARSVGFDFSNRSRTSCQVSAFCANVLVVRTTFSRNPSQRPFLKARMSFFLCSYYSEETRFTHRRFHRMENEWTRSSAFLDLSANTSGERKTDD